MSCCQKMSTKPKRHILTDADALFFYKCAAAKQSQDISNRKDISTVASKFGINIEFKSESCKNRSIEQDCIRIYGYIKRAGKNQIFFNHIRNAFAHLYIEISGTRCKLLDWNPYDSYGKRQNFKASLITMHGDVSYDSLKKLLCEFFSNKSKTKKK